MASFLLGPFLSPDLSLHLHWGSPCLPHMRLPSGCSLQTPFLICKVRPARPTPRSCGGGDATQEGWSFWLALPFRASPPPSKFFPPSPVGGGAIGQDRADIPIFRWED